MKKYRNITLVNTAEPYTHTVLVRKYFLTIFHLVKFYRQNHHISNKKVSTNIFDNKPRSQQFVGFYIILWTYVIKKQMLGHKNILTNVTKMNKH